jgi:type II secretory pathway pseudopilin PulG
VELLVVIAIVALLVGLMLPAIQKSREAALRMKSKNQLRQIGIGLQNYASVNGHLPGFVYPDRPDTRDDPPLYGILRYVEATFAPQVPLYIDPADPTSMLEFGRISRTRARGNSSYAVNMLAFQGLPDPLAGFPDGTSNTIGLAEHYARCGPNARYNYLYSLRYSSVKPYDVSRLNEQRRSTFADAYYGDVVPVSDGAGGTQPSRPGVTFQVAPTPDQCDPLIPQTAFAGGMPALLCDGSVRTFTSGMSPAAFWAAVTRDGGEVIGID